MVSILLLPSLALEEVLSNLISVELFTLSLCSARAFRVSRNASRRQKRKCNISIWMSRSPNAIIDRDDDFRWDLYAKSISEENDEKEIAVVRRNWRFNQTPFEISVETGELNTYWENPNSGFVGMLKRIIDIFETTVHNLVFYEDEVDGWMQTTNLLRECKCSLFEMTMYLDNVTNDEDISNMLNTTSLTDTVAINDMEPSDTFILNDKRNYDFETLIINDGYWVTGKRLLTMNCETIVITKTKLRSVHMNKFFQHWLNGGCDRLKSITIRSNLLNVTRMLSKIPYTVNTHRDNRDLPYRFRRNMTQYNIRRHDNVIASIIMSYNEVEMIVLTS